MRVTKDFYSVPGWRFAVGDAQCRLAKRFVDDLVKMGDQFGIQRANKNSGLNFEQCATQNPAKQVRWFFNAQDYRRHFYSSNYSPMMYWALSMSLSIIFDLMK